MRAPSTVNAECLNAPPGFSRRFASMLVRFGFTGVLAGRASGTLPASGHFGDSPFSQADGRISVFQGRILASYGNELWVLKRCSCRLSSVWDLTSRVDETCLSWCVGEFTARVPLLGSSALMPIRELGECQTVSCSAWSTWGGR